MFMMFLMISLLSSAQDRLPEDARRILDSRLSVQYQIVDRLFYTCDLNGDSLRDYAFVATVDASTCQVEYVIALIATAEGYEFHLLVARVVEKEDESDITLVLHKKGETVSNFDRYDDKNDTPERMELTTDALEIVPLVGCCSTISIYEHHIFKEFTSSD